jgi:hypothetical protein
MGKDKNQGQEDAGQHGMEGDEWPYALRGWQRRHFGRRPKLFIPAQPGFGAVIGALERANCLLRSHPLKPSYPQKHSSGMGLSISGAKTRFV